MGAASATPSGVPGSPPASGSGAGAPGFGCPVRWQGLWRWYGYWTASLAGYAPRRAEVRGLAAPVVEALERQRSGLPVSGPGGGPLTWADLGERLAGLSAKLGGALSRDSLQGAGRRARENLIDCAALPADLALAPADQVRPRAGDATAWPGLFPAPRVLGGHREKPRRLIRAAWDLAPKVTHGKLGRTGAFAAARATALIARAPPALPDEATAPAPL